MSSGVASGGIARTAIEAPLSTAQYRMWLLAACGAAYHTPIGVCLRGPLSRAALGQALDFIIGRHAMLRTRYVRASHGPVAMIDPPAHVPIAFEDLTTESDPDQRLRDRLREEVLAPIDLSTTVIRPRLFRIAPDEHAMVLATHHITMDGWSMCIVVPELMRAYEAFVAGRTPELPPLTFEYRELAAVEREALNEESLEEHLSYWARELEGAPGTIGLPTDHPRPPEPRFEGKRRQVGVPRDAFDAVAALALRLKVSPFACFVACLDILLMHWTGQADLVVGTVSQGRIRRELGSVVGNCINFRPIRARMQSSSTIAETITAVGQHMHAGRTHVACPFERIVERLRNVDHHPNRSPLYNVAILFNTFLHGGSGGHNDLRRRMEALTIGSTDAIGFAGAGEVTAGFGLLYNHAALVDLRFVIVPYKGDGGELRVECEYRSDLFDDDTIDLLLEAYVSILRHVVASSASSIDAISIPAALVARAVAARERSRRAHESLPPQEHVAPGTELESTLAGIFAEVLNRDAVGVTDNFFVLGGDSIRVAQILAALEATFDLKVPPTIVASHPTVRSLAEALLDELERESAGEGTTDRATGAK